MKNWLLAFTFLFAAGALAQTIDPPRLELKDGTILYPKAIRRDGDLIMAKVDRPPNKPGDPVQTAEIGFSLDKISTLYFPKPAILDTAPTLISSGKAAEAASQLENDLRFYGGLRDAPGSWWDELAPLHIQALLAMQKFKEAGEAADAFARMATAEENKKISLAFVAVGKTQKGEHQSSLSLYDEAYKATKRPDILGLIAVNKGDSLLALGDALKVKGEVEQADKRYEGALLSYLRIPALYPSQRQYLAQATFGAARAYFGIEDFDRALVSIKELREGFPGTREAQACNELEVQVKKRKEQLADPKAAAAAAAAKDAAPAAAEPKPES